MSEATSQISTAAAPPIAGNGRYDWSAAAEGGASGVVKSAGRESPPEQILNDARSLLCGVFDACGALRAIATTEISCGETIQGTTVDWLAERIGETATEASSMIEEAERRLRRGGRDVDGADADLIKLCAEFQWLEAKYKRLAAEADGIAEGDPLKAAMEAQLEVIRDKRETAMNGIAEIRATTPAGWRAKAAAAVSFWGPERHQTYACDRMLWSLVHDVAGVPAGKEGGQPNAS